MPRPQLPPFGYGPWDDEMRAVIKDAQTSLDTHDEAIATKVSASQVQTVVADAIAQDSTVALAAIDAVSDVIVDLDVLEGGNQATAFTGAVFSVVDDDGRRSWIEVGEDGGLTQHATDLIAESVAEPMATAIGLSNVDGSVADISFAITDADGRRSWIESDLSGRPTEHAIDLIAEGLGIALGGSANRYPSADWAHWGDSLTAGWPTNLAALTGRSHYNGGVGGQQSIQIAARQGGTPALVTLTGNAIPASGPVAATEVVNGPFAGDGALLGHLGAIEGSLSYDASEDEWTFARSNDGDETELLPLTEFTPYHGVLYRDRRTTIMIGRNDYLYWATPMRIVSRIQAMIDFLSPQVKQVIVMDILPSTSETIGTSGRSHMDYANETLAIAFASYWLPLGPWLRTTDAADAAGITFSAQDLTDIGNGITPSSFRSDSLHFNSTGYAAVAARIWAEAQERGWH